MKKILPLIFYLLIALCGGAWAASSGASLKLTYPKVYEAPLGKIIIYQPQVLSYHDGSLRLDIPIALITKQPKALSQFGILSGECVFELVANHAQGQCKNFNIHSLSLPTLKHQQQSLSQWFKGRLAKDPINLSQAEIDNSLKIQAIEQQRKAQQYNVDPPKIYVSEVSTALVLIDGDPQFQKVKASLSRIMNTSFVILYDSRTGQYYLRAGPRWMMAKNLYSKWYILETLPDELLALEEQLSPKKEEAAFSSNPNVERVIVSTEPAALLQTDGTPRFAPIRGTDLLYVSNSDNDIFLHLNEQQYYTLLSGRWFMTKEWVNDGDWVYVPGEQLPKAFRDIPLDSIKAHVLVSVPGSALAKEAVIKNLVPTTAIIRRDKAKLSVEYDGKPEFKLIENTTIQYATNTRNAVFRVGANYYANYRGIWFISASPLGPWVVAVNIPRIIYTIPPSSPFYNVTFNYIYAFDPLNVYIGYTPGYFGSFIFANTVLFGTGFYYPGWLGAYYFGFPMTFGMGFTYNPIWGWFPGAFFANPWWFGAGLLPNIIGPFGFNGWFGPLFFNNWFAMPFFFNNFYMLWGPNVTLGRIGFFYFDRALREQLLREMLQARVDNLIRAQRERVDQIKQRQQEREKRQRQKVKNLPPPIIAPPVSPRPKPIGKKTKYYPTTPASPPPKWKRPKKTIYVYPPKHEHPPQWKRPKKTIYVYPPKHKHPPQWKRPKKTIYVYPPKHKHPPQWKRPKKTIYVYPPKHKHPPQWKRPKKTIYVYPPKHKHPPQWKRPKKTIYVYPPKHKHRPSWKNQKKTIYVYPSKRKTHIKRWNKPKKTIYVYPKQKTNRLYWNSKPIRFQVYPGYKKKQQRHYKKTYPQQRYKTYYH